MSYSLAAQCGSEIIGMMLVIYLGESIIANEVLAKTKGNRMGWLAVALGFGMSFGVVIFMFAYISAHLNPATCLALWVIGKMPFTHFLAVAASEFAGAFLGACLVFLHYIPHFKTIPEPPAADDSDLLLRSRDALSPEALAIASYDTRQRPSAGTPGMRPGIMRAVKDLRFYFTESHPEPQEHSELVGVALGPDELKGGAQEAEGRLRRRSVQVCDVHRRLQDMSLEEFSDKLYLKTAGGRLTRPASINLGQLANATADARTTTDGAKEFASDNHEFPPFEARASAPTGQRGGAGYSSGGSLAEAAAAQGQARAGRFTTLSQGLEAVPAQLASVYRKHVERYGEKQSRLYDAAVIADQNAKLSIFATRPAIYTPVFNFLCEVMCTCALVFGALMMYARRDMLDPQGNALFRSTEGIWIGFYVFVCILGLGGPTGIAANPARDFSPRLAHALLPIAGKGPSEWFYAPVPFLAPFVGGALAGGFYLAVQKLNHSEYVAVPA